MNIITDIEKLIERFGDWIRGVFNAAQKVYNKMSDEEKAAAHWAYGLIALVNNNLDKTPAEIIALIKAYYPDLSLDLVHGFLEKVLNDLGIFQSQFPVTLEDALTALAKYLGMLKGDAWKRISETIGSLLAVLLSPSTPVQKFVAVAELVYQTIVKPHQAAA